MFTNKKAKYYGDDKVLLDSACLSTDTKPTTGVANGSKLLEMDTSTVYAFDEANGEWLAQSSSGGGGGGGGGTEPLIINVIDDADGFRMDKTFGEIRQALDNGRTLLVVRDDSYGVTTGASASVVLGYSYSVTGGEYPSAYGDVSVGNSSYSASCSEAPYTLDAVDALYPRMAD